MNREACYDVPAWHRLLWGEQRATLPEAPRVESSGDAKVAGFGDGFMPELFHTLYAESPAEVVEPGKPAAARGKLHKLANELPEFSTLRGQTVRDPMWAGLATAVLGEHVANALPVHKTPPADADKAKRILEGLRDLGAGGTEDEARAEGDAAGAAFAVQEQAESLDESAIRQALRRGIEAAGEAIGEAEDALDAMGCGYGPGADNATRVAPGVAADLARRVKNSSKLRRIVELAGRLKATSRAKRATKAKYARSEVVGIEQTGDIARLLPSELGALCDPLREVDLFRRLGERTALGYRLAGREKTAKGPIVVGLDISGSMGAGDKDEWAKAIALALLDIAKHDKRAFGLILYETGGVHGSLFAESADKVQIGDLMDLLSQEPTRGGDFDIPIVPCLDVIEKRATFGKADVILVTDAQASTEYARESMARADRIGAHVYGIKIGRGSLDTIKAYCHEACEIDDINSDTKATNLVFEGI